MTSASGFRLLQRSASALPVVRPVYGEDNRPRVIEVPRMPQLLPVAAAIAALVLPTAVSATPPASPAVETATVSSASPFAPSAKEKRYERKLRTYTNKARKNHGRKVLRRKKCVDRFADRWARKMARRQAIGHQNLRRVMRRCDLRRVGENVAFDTRGPKSMFRGWMRSSGHRANILQRRYRLLGVGVARDKHGAAFASQVFGRR